MRAAGIVAPAGPWAIAGLRTVLLLPCRIAGIPSGLATALLLSATVIAALGTVLLLPALIIIAASAFAAHLLKALETDLSDYIGIGRFNLHGLFALHFHGLQFFRLDALLVERFYLAHPLDGERILLGAFGRLYHMRLRKISFFTRKARLRATSMVSQSSGKFCKASR